MPETFAVQAAACTSCGHQHTTADMGYICVGCPCPLRPGKLAAELGAKIAAAQAAAVVDPNGAPEWLAQLCRLDSGTEELRRPFPVEDQGVRFAAATDSKCMIAIRGDFTMEPAPGIAARVAEILPLPATAEAVPFARFLDWAVKGAHRAPCTTCRGERTKPCKACRAIGEIDCRCRDCDHEHTATCGECEGTKRVACDCTFVPVIAGWALGKRLNRALFGPFVAHFNPAETVQVGTSAHPTSPVTFWTDAWRLIVMPMAPERGTVAEPEEEL